jgi:hypothetical protein
MPNSRNEKGSRARCLKLTGWPLELLARALTTLAYPSGAVVTSDDCWMPQGDKKPAEAKLEIVSKLLSEVELTRLTSWWLAVPKGANTPNWDIASTYTFGSRKGILLVEAKAHEREFSRAGKRAPTTPNGERNHDQIANAIAMANSALNDRIKGWSLSRDRYYQLSNRFAWAWKLASLGVPVVLLYLGFLNADEMGDGPFRTPADWTMCVLEHARGVVPDSVWGKPVDIGGTPIWPLIASDTLDLPK